MIVERDLAFIVKMQDRWMLNEMKAYAGIKNTNKISAAENLYNECAAIIDED